MIMQKNYGMTPPPAPAQEPMVVRFFDGPLALNWVHCGATAKFIGEYYAGLAAHDRCNVNDARHSINYLANELMENAIKFRAAGTVELQSAYQDGVFEMRLSNYVDAAAVDRFQGMLEEITTHDAGDLLIERIEANALNPDSGGSGLGFLTMMNDYGVEFGWTFAQAETASTVRVETYAALRLV